MSRIRIIGAGIAGLTAALALRRTRLDFEVHERAPYFTQLGAGIVLASNAVHLLSQLGADLVSVGQPVARDHLIRLHQRRDQ